MAQSTNRFPLSLATATRLIEGDYDNQNPTSTPLKSNVDISSYVHSSIFEVLQPSKNLKVKLCSFKNLETLEDDVYQKHYQKDNPNKSRNHSIPHSLTSTNLNHTPSHKNQDTRLQKNKNNEHGFSNNVISLSKNSLKDKSISNIVRSSDELGMKKRNFSEVRSTQNLGTQIKGILKDSQKQSSLQKVQALQDDEVLLQLNLFSKKNQSSITPRNLQFLAVKKDQFQKTLNYLEQLNQVNEEIERKSQQYLAKDQGNQSTSKINLQSQHREDTLNVIKSFANIAEIQTKQDITSRNTIQQDNAIAHTLNTPTNNQSANKYISQNNSNSNLKTNVYNQPSLIINNIPFNRNSLAPIVTQTSHQRLQSITALNDNNSHNSHTKLSSHSRFPSHINLDNSNHKLGSFRSPSKKDLTRPSQSQSKQQQSISQLKNQQTLQLEEIHISKNPSTLDQIDQLSSSNEKIEKPSDNTEPIPQANTQQIDRNIKKQKTISYKNETTRAKNISLLNLQEINTYNNNRDPLSSRKTADSTPFDIKPVHNMEAHLSQFRLKPELTPASTNINSKIGLESDDRKSTQNDSQFHSTFQKKQTPNDIDKNTSHQKQSIRQISPFLIHQTGHKNGQIVHEDLENSKVKLSNNANRFDSPAKNSSVSFLNSEMKEHKASHSAQSSLIQSDFDSCKKRMSKIDSKDLESTKRRLNVSVSKRDSQNDQFFTSNLQQMNASQLNSISQLSAANSLQKNIEQISPLKSNANLKTIFTSENSESDNTSPVKKKQEKPVDEKKQEPISQFIQQLYKQQFNEKLEVPSSIQQLNNGEIFQSPRFYDLENKQNEIFNKFIQQPPFIQGKVKCGLNDYIKQQKKIEMNRLKTYYKFGFSASNKDEKSIKLQNVLEGVVPSNEIGSIQCSDLWSDKHVKIIHDRVNFIQEKSFIQQYLAYKSRNPAKSIIVQNKKPTQDFQRMYEQYEKQKRHSQNDLEPKCLTDRYRESKNMDTMNNSVDTKSYQKTIYTPSPTSKKRLTTKSSSMTQSNFKKMLPFKTNFLIQKPEDLTREKILFKDLIQFTDKVLSSNSKDIRAYSKIKKYEDEEQI